MIVLPVIEAEVSEFLNSRNNVLYCFQSTDILLRELKLLNISYNIFYGNIPQKYFLEILQNNPNSLIIISNYGNSLENMAEVLIKLQKYNVIKFNNLEIKFYGKLILHRNNYE